MPMLLLVRHGENDLVKRRKMAGQLPGVHLNDRGREQAQALADSLRDAPIRAIHASPLERAIETAQPLADARGLAVRIEPGLIETGIGAWQGRSWLTLSRLKVWRVVQEAPSRFRFPDGETFLECQARIASTLDGICACHRPSDLIVCVSHADPIKLAVANYLGLPLDRFQRLACDTGSATLLAVHPTGARLVWLNRQPPFTIEALKKK